MNDEWQIIWETDFKIVDKKELEKINNLDELKDLNDLNDWWNLRDDLIRLGLLDYENLSEEEKKVFDELENEKRENDLYKL